MLESFEWYVVAVLPDNSDNNTIKVLAKTPKPFLANEVLTQMYIAFEATPFKTALYHGTTKRACVKHRFLALCGLIEDPPKKEDLPASPTPENEPEDDSQEPVPVEHRALRKNSTIEKEELPYNIEQELNYFIQDMKLGTKREAQTVRDTFRITMARYSELCTIYFRGSLQKELRELVGSMAEALEKTRYYHSLSILFKKIHTDGKPIVLRDVVIKIKEDIVKDYRNKKTKDTQILLKAIERHYPLMHDGATMIAGIYYGVIGLVMKETSYSITLKVERTVLNEDPETVDPLMAVVTRKTRNNNRKRLNNNGRN